MSVTYPLAEFLNDRATVQILWDNPPANITNTIELYINFSSVHFNTDATIVARLQVTSVPATATATVPEVTLTSPNGTEGSSLELTLKNTTAGIEHCYDELQDINHTLYCVQANIHSPEMYNQLDEHIFFIRLTLYSPENSEVASSLQHLTETYILTVNITGGMRTIVLSNNK